MGVLIYLDERKHKREKKRQERLNKIDLTRYNK